MFWKLSWKSIKKFRYFQQKSTRIQYMHPQVSHECCEDVVYTSSCWSSSEGNVPSTWDLNLAWRDHHYVNLSIRSHKSSVLDRSIDKNNAQTYIEADLNVPCLLCTVEYIRHIWKKSHTATYWTLVKVMLPYHACGVAHKKKGYSAVTVGSSLQAQVLEHSENSYMNIL